MYSLSYLYQALGDRDLADRCERAAFNALPAAFTRDHWGHQYLTVPNQPFAHKLEDPNPFWNTGVQSIMYGIGKTLSGLLLSTMLRKNRTQLSLLHCKYASGSSEVPLSIRCSRWL